MTVKIEEATRKQVAVFVPELIEMTLQSYRDFMNGGPDDPPSEDMETGKARPKSASKVFAEHHNAGKVALTHLELLLKLASLMNVTSEATKEAGIFVQTGRNEVDEYRLKKAAGEEKDIS